MTTSCSNSIFFFLHSSQSGLVLVDTPGIGENEFLENYLMDYIRKHQILGFMYVIMTDYPLGIAEDRVSLQSYFDALQQMVSNKVCLLFGAYIPHSYYCLHLKKTPKHSLVLNLQLASDS